MDAAGTLGRCPPAAPGLDDIRPPPSPAASSRRRPRPPRRRENRAAGERLRSVLPELGVASRSPTTAIKPASARRCGSAPLFDPRSGERARADAVARREDTGSPRARSSFAPPARPHRDLALATHQEARHLHDVVLRCASRSSTDPQHYNAMDADPFALILARRELVDARTKYLDAQRRYWNAMAEVTALSRGRHARRAGAQPQRDDR